MKTRTLLTRTVLAAALSAGLAAVIPSPAHAIINTFGWFAVGCRATGGYLTMHANGAISCRWSDGTEVYCDTSGSCSWTHPPRTANDDPSAPPPVNVLDTTPLDGESGYGHRSVVAVDLVADMTLAQVRDAAWLFAAGKQIVKLSQVLSVQAKTPSLSAAQVDALLSGQDTDAVHLTGVTAYPTPETRLAEIAGASRLSHRRVFVIDTSAGSTDPETANLSIIVMDW